jgi:hypothetical protein
MRYQHEAGTIQIEIAAPAVTNRHLAPIIPAVMIGGGPAGPGGMIDRVAAITGGQILQCGANWLRGCHDQDLPGRWRKLTAKGGGK